MTYYKQFAEMLGLELEQEFTLVTQNGEKANTNTYKIKEDGLYCQSATKDYWFVTSSEYIHILLSGEFKAVPKPFKLKNGEQYWWHSHTSDSACSTLWKGSYNDLVDWKVGNCFRTEEEALVKGKKIIEAIQKEYEEA